MSFTTEHDGTIIKYKDVNRV